MEGQHESGYHFGEWFTVRYFLRQGYEVLPPKYLLPSRVRAKRKATKILSEAGVAFLLRKRRFGGSKPRGSPRPDLLVFKNSKEFFFVEVKRDGDRLSSAQKQFFPMIERRFGCDVKVAKLLPVANPFHRLLSEPLEVKLPSGNSVLVPRCEFPLKLWRGKPIAATHGPKPVLELNGNPVFAEMAIVRILQRAGWDAVWVDNWYEKFRHSMPPHECTLPAHAQELFDRIRVANKGKVGGCFDVLAWKGREYLFVESKWKDSIGDKQKRWLEAALDSGLPLRSFLIFYLRTPKA